MAFIDHFIGMMSDEITVHPGSTDEYGTWTASGATANYPCHIEGARRLTRDSQGREVVSTVQVIVGGAYDLTTHSHRYTLPARFNPRDELQAVAVDSASDEIGPVYEELMFP